MKSSLGMLVFENTDMTFIYLFYFPNSKILTIFYICKQNLLQINK